MQLTLQFLKQVQSSKEIEIRNDRVETSFIYLFIRRDPLIDFYSISYLWYSPIAVLTVLLVGLIVSYITGPLKSKDIDRKYLISIRDICPFLPSPSVAPATTFQYQH